MISNKKDYLHLSITATGRCNASCDYCHFYAKRPREEMMYDINEYIFKYYINLVKYIKNDIRHENITYRLSGGEPLVLGNRMYDMCNYAYKTTGIKLNVLTNGILLNEKVIEDSKKNNVGAYIVSMENPFEIAQGAADPYDIIKKISKFNSDELPVVPGIVIVSNKMFDRLEEICDYFYEKIGYIPSISEKTYSVYESPTEEELIALKENVKRIVFKYADKTNLELFPYIIPEIINKGENEYLVELDIEGNCIRESYAASYDYLINKINKSYPKICCNVICDWKKYCATRKWLWDHSTNQISAEEKRKDYCNYKKALCEGYLEGLTLLDDKTNG